MWSGTAVGLHSAGIRTRGASKMVVRSSNTSEKLGKATGQHDRPLLGRLRGSSTGSDW